MMRRLGIYGLPKRRMPRGAKVGKPNSLTWCAGASGAERPTGCG